MKNNWVKVCSDDVRAHQDTRLRLARGKSSAYRTDQIDPLIN